MSSSIWLSRDEDNNAQIFYISLRGPIVEVTRLSTVGCCDELYLTYRFMHYSTHVSIQMFLYVPIWSQTVELLVLVDLACARCIRVRFASPVVQ